MNNVVVINIIRFIILVLIQVLILKNIEIYPPYIHLFIYPLFLIMLPFTTPPWAMLLMGFLLGISVDLFYDSAGLHAGASVLMAYVRSFICKGMEPRGGFDNNHYPNKRAMGFVWFAQFASILLAFHIFWIMMFEAFVLADIGLVIIQTILSFILSILLIGIYQFIANPKY